MTLAKNNEMPYKAAIIKAMGKPITVKAIKTAAGKVRIKIKNPQPIFAAGRSFIVKTASRINRRESHIKIKPAKTTVIKP